MKLSKRWRRPSLFGFFFILYLAGLCFSEERNGPSPRFSLKLSGGSRYARVGDINKHLGSFNSLSYISGEVAKVDNWSSDWEIEVRARLSSRLKLGLVTSGFFNKRNQSSLILFGGDAWIPETVKFDTQYTFAPAIRWAMPLGLNLYYSLRPGSRLDLFVGLGTGWYTGKMTENLTTQYFQSDGQTYFGARHWSADNAFSLGFQGCLGLEYDIAGALSLVVELQGRYARIGGLTGRVTFMNNFSREEEIGTLYYFRTRMGEIGPWYTELVVRQGLPEGGIAPVEDAREAFLDLSGYSLKIGLNLALF